MVWSMRNRYRMFLFVSSLGTLLIYAIWIWTLLTIAR